MNVRTERETGYPTGTGSLRILDQFVNLTELKAKFKAKEASYLSYKTP